jgi:hypothetical protein
LNPSEDISYRSTSVELVSVISSEWLEESELSSDVIHLDSPSLPICCSIDSDHIDALCNPVVGINIMSASLAQHLMKHMTLTPTTKLMKTLSGHIVPQFRNFTYSTNPGRRNLGSFELLCLPHMGLRPADRTTP